MYLQLCSAQVSKTETMGLKLQSMLFIDLYELTCCIQKAHGECRPPPRATISQYQLVPVDIITDVVTKTFRSKVGTIDTPL